MNKACIFISIIGLLNLNCLGQTIRDYDGNVYKTVSLGSQTWMAKNLKVTHYRNGDSIPGVADDASWENLTSGAYCDYNNNPANTDLLGHLYNWYSVADDRNICPQGWHVPSDSDWKVLADFLGGRSVAGGYMKIEDIWLYPNTGGTNASGFSALPGGQRIAKKGRFDMLVMYGRFWSSTSCSGSLAWNFWLSFHSKALMRAMLPKAYGISVRCLKD